jgi:hypothetical protein
MYIPSRDFIQASPQRDSPLGYCLSNGLDVGFSKGYTSFTQGSRSKNCQAFMAQRCAENWDGFCEYNFYEGNKINQGGFSNKLWPDLFSPVDWGNQRATQPPGNQFLRNVLITKYCVFPTGIRKEQSFDPTNANSPMIYTWESPNGLRTLVPVCNRIDPKTIDSDPVMNKALENLDACHDIIINILNTCKRDGIDLRGTKIGTLQERYLQNMRRQ